jgi:hypothetical protein
LPATPFLKKKPHVPTHECHEGRTAKVAQRNIPARQVHETQEFCRKNPDAHPPGFIQEKPIQYSFFLVFLTGIRDSLKSGISSV